MPRPIAISAHYVCPVVLCDEETLQQYRVLDEQRQQEWRASKPYPDINIWIGSQTDALNKSALEENGVTAIINVAVECRDLEGSVLVDPDDPQLVDGKINILRLDIEDHSDSDIEKAAERAVTFATKASTKPHYGLLIHCSRGISRAPTIACAVLSRLFGKKNIRDTMEDIKQCRPITSPNLGFELYLDSLP